MLPTNWTEGSTVQLSSSASWRWDVVGKATTGWRGSQEPWLNWGPEENEKDTTLPTITLGSKYFSYVRSPAPSHMQTLSNPFRKLAIKWEVNIFIKKSSCVCYPLRQYVSCMNMYMTIQQYGWHSLLRIVSLSLCHHVPKPGINLKRSYLKRKSPPVIVYVLYYCCNWYHYGYTALAAYLRIGEKYPIHAKQWLYVFCSQKFGQERKVVVSGPVDRDSILSRVIPKIQKMVLDANLLST